MESSSRDYPFNLMRNIYQMQHNIGSTLEEDEWL